MFARPMRGHNFIGDRVVNMNLGDAAENKDLVFWRNDHNSEIKCQQWLEKMTLNSDGESVCNSESSCTSSSIEENHEFNYNVNELVHNVETPVLKQTESLNMNQCKYIHVGNITNYYGPVYLTESLSMINHHSVTNQIVIQAPPDKLGELNMIYRNNWKAIPPMKEPTPMEAPAKFVIICHTESQAEDTTQTENTRLIQSIQKYHFRKRNLEDISYNFLIGTDANVYEGRGWNVQAAFARKYNKFSVGISFVGYYEEKLPSEECLAQCHALIRHGVAIGAIDENYSLLAHCQSVPTDSPGERFYYEIRRWKNWNGSIDVLHPAPIVVK